MSTEKKSSWDDIDKRPGLFLYEFYFGAAPKIRYHISHNDLDGYACNLSTSIAATISEKLGVYGNDWYLGGECYCNSANIPIPRYLNSTIEGFFEEHCNSMRSSGVWILITDLGGIDPFDLYAVLNNCRAKHGNNNIPIRVCIMDHHINTILDKISDGKNKAYVLRRDKSNDITRFSMVNDGIVIDYYGNTKKSAAKILAEEFLKNQIVKNELQYTSVHRILQFVNYVSLWDTGNFGYWYSNKIHEVDKQVKYNLLFSHFGQMDSLTSGEDKTDVMRRLFVSQLADYFYDPDHPGAFLDNYNEIAETRLRKMNDDYFEFLKLESKRINLLEALTAGQILLEIEGESYTVKIPGETLVKTEDYDPVLENMDIVVFKDTEEFNSYSYSPYAQRYLKDPREKNGITIRINKHSNGDISVDMRSLHDEISVQPIAFVNGGGGHKKAAGFPIIANKK